LRVDILVERQKLRDFRPGIVRRGNLPGQILAALEFARDEKEDEDEDDGNRGDGERPKEPSASLSNFQLRHPSCGP
jgi:hypothetical protein